MSRFCCECKWSGTLDGELVCFNSKVNALNWQMLSSPNPEKHFYPTYYERRNFLSPCNRFGVQWEAMPNEDEE